MADGNNDGGFGDFIFASHHQPKSHSGGAQINFGGGFDTIQKMASVVNDDEDWGDFVVSPSCTSSEPSYNSSSFQSNGFSGLHPSSSYRTPPPSIGFDAFGFHNGNSGQPAAESPAIRVVSDPKKVGFEKPRGPLPLSIFGGGNDEEEEEERDGSSAVGKSSNGLLHQKPSETVANVNRLNLEAGITDILASLYTQSQPIKSENGSNLNSDILGFQSISDPSLSDGDKRSDDEDDWYFKGAFSDNGGGERNFKNQGNSDSSGTKLESMFATNQEQRRGQEESSKVENELGSKKASPELTDLFSGQHGASNAKGQMKFANHFKSPSIVPNGFMSFPLSGSVENGAENRPYSINVDVNDDEFGDFMDASVERELKHQESATRPESYRQPLAVSFCSNGVVESGHSCENDSIDEPSSNPRNGISSQGSANSIHDIISKLYNQSQHVSSVDYNKKDTENGLHPTLDLSTVTTQNGFDQSFWDSREEAIVEEKTSVPDFVGSKTLITSTDLQIYIDFYTGLRKELWFLVSYLADDAEEALKILQDNMDFGETHAEKNAPRKICCNELLEVLHQPMFQMLESEYFLSRRLQLAEKDWNLSVELLKEVQSSIKVLTLGTVDCQYAYVSAWVVIINACAQQLRCGASIWKQAIEKNLQSQILSDPRGQQYIQSLGEIYRIAQLVGASAKVYKLWILLLSKQDCFSFFPLFDECVALWLSSGLEQALQNLLGVVDSESCDAIKVLLKSIEHIQEINIVALIDSAFLQQRSICHMSLLPQEMLPELKMVSWNEENYFLKVANLWANLISHNPPSLPQLQVG